MVLNGEMKSLTLMKYLQKKIKIKIVTRGAYLKPMLSIQE